MGAAARLTQVTPSPWLYRCDLTAVLIGIDITLAGLFWAMGVEYDIIGRFLEKMLARSR